MLTVLNCILRSLKERAGVASKTRPFSGILNKFLTIIVLMSVAFTINNNLMKCINYSAKGIAKTSTFNNITINKHSVFEFLFFQ